jgi:hypothetical protein
VLRLVCDTAALLFQTGSDHQQQGRWQGRIGRPATVLRLLTALVLTAFASAAIAGTNLWDGQYECEGEGPGGVPYHHYLIVFTTNQTSRVIFNGKELSHVSLTTNGFTGKASGFKIPGSFVQLQGTNAVILAKDDPYLKIESNLQLGCVLEGMGQPFFQTHGRGKAAECFKRAKTAHKQYDQFLAKFRAALKLPDKECLAALRPLMEPLADNRPDSNTPGSSRINGKLTLALVHSLKRAGYHPDAAVTYQRGDCQGRSLVNGPFEYFMHPNLPGEGQDDRPGYYYTGFCGELNLKAELVAGQIRITTIQYSP